MKLNGKVWKDGKLWMIEVPALDAMTQGHTKAEAFEMIVDLVQMMASAEGFEATVTDVHGESFFIQGSNTDVLVALMLRRLRAASGLSLAQVSKRMGASSRTAFARYEKGEVAPTIPMLDALLQALKPDGGLKVLWA